MNSLSHSDTNGVAGCLPARALEKASRAVPRLARGDAPRRPPSPDQARVGTAFGGFLKAVAKKLASWVKNLRGSGPGACPSQGRETAIKGRTTRPPQLVFYLQVFDTGHDQVLGHLVDIDNDSMRLICERPIPTGRAYAAEINWPRSGHGTKTIRVRAECCWCRKHSQRALHVAQFRLVQLSTDERESIEHVTQDFEAQLNQSTDA